MRLERTPASPGAVPRPRRGLGRLTSGRPEGYLFVLPYAMFFLAMVAYPLGFAAYMAFHRWNIVSTDRPFVGLGNFARMLADPVFGTALSNTGKYLLVNLPLTVAGALVLAVALNAKLPGRAFFRGAYFLPYVTAGVVVSLIWKWMFSTDDGVVNLALARLGGPKVPWLTSPEWSMVTIAGMVAWKHMGFYTVLYLGGLQGIPAQLYEAARIDGATGWQQFRFVTVPQLRPITLLVVVLATITGFQVFTEPYVMTGGGPLNSSLSPVLYIYQKAFQSLDFGYAAALGLTLAAITLLAALAQRRLLDRD